MVKQQITLNNQVAREFAGLGVGTQNLAWTILGKPPTGTEQHIIHLGNNLRRSDFVVWLVEQLIKNKPLGVNWQDCLELIGWDCLEQYHKETYDHLQRIGDITKNLKYMLQRYALCDLEDYGYHGFENVRNQFCLTDQDWEMLQYAAIFHDHGKMGYPDHYWQIPEFNEQQAKEKEDHSRLFYFYGELFNVDRLVIGLSVLHHYPNQCYPQNGVVKNFIDLIKDQKFNFMLRLLVNFDIYEALTAYRSYSRGTRKGKFSHQQALEIMPTELKAIGTGFIPFIQGLKDHLGQATICPR